MSGKDKLMIPVLGVLPSACGPQGFDTLEGFGEVADDEAEGETSVPIEGPFELEAAEFEDLDTLVLTFSHPLDSFAEVDPASFRISLGLATSYFSPYYGTYYQSTRYWDPNYVGYYYGGSNQFNPIALSAGPQDDQLRIEFEEPLEDYACTMIANLDSMPLEPPDSRDVGLFVHHDPGLVPLRDILGDELPATGPDWVAWPYEFMFVEGPWFTYLDPIVEIPCP
jgi:hypothetical protein